MALLWIDGFDIADMSIKYSGTSSATGSQSTTTTTRFNTGRHFSTNGVNQFIKKTITPASKVITGFAFAGQTGQINSNVSFLVVYGDTGATAHLSLRLLSDGSVRLHLGDAGTVLATSAPLSLRAVGKWSYIELSGTVADSGGRAIVRVDGVTVIDFTGDTKNGGTSTAIDTVRLQGDYTVDCTFFDDWYICDGTGVVNNDFLGDVRVQTLLPTGAGSSTQLTPTGVANNWDNVNDNPANTGTYNSDSVSGHRDTYAMADLNAYTGTVFGVQDVIMANRSDSGAANIKAALRSGGTVYYDATQNLGTSVSAYAAALREADPATSAAWTVANVNALEFGAEIAGPVLATDALVGAATLTAAALLVAPATASLDVSATLTSAGTVT